MSTRRQQEAWSEATDPGLEGGGGEVGEVRREERKTPGRGGYLLGRSRVLGGRGEQAVSKSCGRFLVAVRVKLSVRRSFGVTNIKLQIGLAHLRSPRKKI